MNQNQQFNQEYLSVPTSSKDLNAFNNNHQQNSSIHLSNLYQKSYFSSQAEDPDPQEIEDFLFKIEKLKEVNAETAPQIKKSTRLQDQQIIVVEEQNELQSNNDGKQSIILEHIQFQANSHPNKQQFQEQKLQLQKDLIKKNYQQVKDQNQYEQQLDSFQEDLESIDYKINYNRQSKNTCSDPKRSLLSVPKKLVKSNRTLKLNDLQDEDPTITLNSKQRIVGPFPNQNKIDKNDYFANVIDKWANDNYSFSNCSGLSKQQSINPKIKQYNSLKNQQNPFKKQQQVHQLDEIDEQNIFHKRIPPKSNLNQNKGSNIQNDIDRSQCLSKYDRKDALLQIEQQYKKKIQELHLQNQRIKENILTQKQQIKRIKQTLTQKQDELYKYQSRIKQVNKALAQLQKHKKQEQRRLMRKIQQLQSKILSQNIVIKQYQDRMQLANFKMLSRKDEQQSRHKACRQEIEQLQQYIFDIQQKVAGIDIQVQRRTKESIMTVQKNLTQLIRKDCTKQTAHLHQQIRQLNQILQYQQRQRQKREKDQYHLNLKTNELNIRQQEIHYRQVELQKREQNLENMMNEIRSKEVRSYNMYESDHPMDMRSIDSAKNRFSYGSKRIQNNTFNDEHFINSPKYERNIPFQFINSTKPQHNQPQNKISKIQKRFRQKLQNHHFKQHVSQKNIPQFIQKSRNTINLSPTKSHNKNVYKSSNTLFGQHSFNKIKGTENIFHNISVPIQQDKSLRRQSYAKQAQSTQLISINKKIEKLRRQINKQLESIH